MPRPIFHHTIPLQTPHPPGVNRQSVGLASDRVRNDDLVWLVNTTGASLTLTSTPTIADGHDGDRILIVNVSAQPIVLQDQGTLPASGLRLQAATRTLGTRDSLEVIYSAFLGDWLELGFSNVL